MWRYADVAIAGTTLRLPAGGSGRIRPLDAPRGTTATPRLSFGYPRFEEALPKLEEVFELRSAIKR